jgi:rhamnosyltransferase
MQPRVLVLLAAYNGSPWIDQQIKSILGQQGVNPELLIGDDGSIDDTPARINVFVDDARVRTLPCSSPTGSAAQNFLRLIRSAPADNYEFIALADQDDIWLEGKLFRACNSLIATGAAAYSSAVTAFWHDGRQKLLRQKSEPTISDFLFEGAGQGCTFVLSASFYGRLREFLLREPQATEALHFHDWAIYALSRCWALDWRFDEQASVLYRQHSFNDTGARASISGVRRRVALIRSGWYSRQLRVVAQLCRTAAPSNPLVAEWQAILLMRNGASRRWRMVLFTIRGGRRRLSDNLVLLAAMAAGWI